MIPRPSAPRARTLIALAIVVLLSCVLSGCAGLAELQSARESGPPEAARPAPAGAPAGSAASGPAALSPDVERMAREATWASGQLRAHFEKHGKEGPYATAEAYDAAARDTIRTGKRFQYVDRSTNARRNGFYDPAGNRFTAVTDDGRRITTHFRPDNGERYVRGLPQTTYR